MYFYSSDEGLSARDVTKRELASYSSQPRTINWGVALPKQLQAAIERETARVTPAQLACAAEQVSSDYRAGRFGRTLNTPEARAAYLITRLPATFAANEYVYREVARLSPELSPQSLLDLGAGPGTAMWAAGEVWPPLSQSTLIESNREFLKLGQRLASEKPGLRWIENDFAPMAEFPASDFVVLSYALGEVKNPGQLIEKAWRAARQTLVIVEPGTPRNFALLATVRKQLFSLGAHVVAPCPHENACPMVEAGDWCHFSVRLERSAQHRRLKRADLGYEDEKFSYLAVAKQPVIPASARIVRHPQIHGGHIQMALCTPEGLQSKTVTKSNKDAFRAARKAEWGDEWRKGQFE